ncbi:TetR family transcriptional regulator C-terminal domain-containing protein, partial [Oleiphilus sp. HI0080]
MSDKDSAQKTGKIREQNRKNILAAAEDSFVKNGFKGTSMQSIADAAELPKANVLYYFKSKQALYLAVLDEIIRRWDESIDDMSEGDDPAEVLGNYIRAKVDLAIQYPNASKIFALEIIQG